MARVATGRATPRRRGSWRSPRPNYSRYWTASTTPPCASGSRSACPGTAMCWRRGHWRTRTVRQRRTTALDASLAVCANAATFVAVPAMDPRKGGYRRRFCTRALLRVRTQQSSGWVFTQASTACSSGGCRRASALAYWPAGGIGRWHSGHVTAAHVTAARGGVFRTAPLVEAGCRAARHCPDRGPRRHRPAVDAPACCG